MKKVVFTLILLIVLGAAWTLYLEYGNKHFAGSLPNPKGSVTVRQPTNTPESPTAGNKNDQAIPVDSVPSETIAENARVWHEHGDTHAHSHADTPDIVSPPTDAPGHKNTAQTTSQPNPVPPEVIEDSKRDLEWYRVLKKWEEEYWALDTERTELDKEFDELTSVGLEGIQHMGNKEKAAYIAKLNAWQKRSEALNKKEVTLKKEKPVRPIPTHTH